MRTPKLLGDPDAKKRRIAALDNDNSISLGDYIQWCGASLPEGVTLPEFDPYDGGRTAKGLVVLSYPGPASESGIVSSENPDSTAANLSRYLDNAGIDRKNIVIWNLVPWFTPESHRTLTKVEMEKGSQCLSKLISSLPCIKQLYWWVSLHRAIQSSKMLLIQLSTFIHRISLNNLSISLNPLMR